MASKSEMVSVRVGPDIKAALQEAARREMRSTANMIEVMVVAYCRQQGYSTERGLTAEPMAFRPGEARDV